MMLRLTAIILLLCAGATRASPPPDFEKAKVLARTHVYADRNTVGDAYCGCRWRWVGRSGGRIDPSSCGYRVRAQPERGSRIEWEHVVPAHSFGQVRQCWQQGGRKHCQATDPVFNAFESDLHNLTPVVGEVNADRAHFRLGVLPSTALKHGSCPFKVDFSQRVAEPPDTFKGAAARIYYYTHYRYRLPMSDAQERLLMAWDRQFPVSDWERERDRRIARVMGWSNPFVTGERTWNRGYRPVGEAVVTLIPASHPARSAPAPQASTGDIRANRRSGVYHAPGCPSYDQVSPSNTVLFDTESAAVAAGYRRAGNCR